MGVLGGFRQTCCHRHKIERIWYVNDVKKLGMI